MFPETFRHEWYPFRNQAEIDRVRAITRKDIEAMHGRHPSGNPNVTVEVVRNEEFGDYMVADMVQRIVDSDRYDTPCNLVMCNPCTTYITVAHILRRLKVNMRNVKFFMMDEWADEDGNVAPLTWPHGFGYFFTEYMLKNIRGLGFREENFIYHSNETTPIYSRLLEDAGEADCVYSGPGWPGHLAFIDPVGDWFKPTMEEYLAQGAKVASLHPLTIAQNSLHGCFGCSGDISRVPPKGAMMGPRDAMKAKNVLDMHAITTAGSRVTWQRLTSRLCIFGTPDQTVPASILQLRDKPTRILMSENLAADIEPDPYFQY